MTSHPMRTSDEFPDEAMRILTRSAVGFDLVLVVVGLLAVVGGEVAGGLSVAVLGLVAMAVVAALSTSSGVDGRSARGGRRGGVPR